MRAVSYRLRRLIGARLGSTVVLTVIVALLAGVAICCAAGARRTTSAPDRYTARVGQGFDAQIMQNEGPSAAAEISKLPAVARVEATTFFFGVVAPAGTADFFDAIAFAGSAAPLGAPIVEGRAADPANRNEFMATLDLVQANHLSLGQSFDVRTLTVEQVQEFGFNAPTFDGPSWTAVLVGVVDGSASLDDTGSILIFPSATLDDPGVAFASTVMWVDERPGADLSTLHAQLDTLADNANFALQEVLVSADVRTAVQAQGRGLWLLALVAGVAAVAVLGQLISRQVRLSAADRERLSALGFTNMQIMAESVGRAALPVAFGSVLGAALAIAPSGLFPTGFVKRLEPDPGLRLDLTVVLVGAGGFLVALTAWIVVALLLTSRKARPVRPSPTIELLAARAPTATAATGLRFAFAQRRHSGGSVKGAMAGLIVTVGALVGALTFGVSMNRLVDQPERFGVNFDISTDDGADDIAPEVLDVLANDPDISGATLYATVQARVQAQTVDLMGMVDVRGDLRPPLLSGRLPAAQDEVALGRLTSHDLHAGIGDDVMLSVDGTPSTYRVTGLAVLPGLAGDDGIGHGVLMTMPGLERLVPDVEGNLALIDVRDGAAPDTFQRIAQAVGVGGESGGSPSAIANLKRVRGIPFVLAGVLAVLLLLTVGHVMLTSLRNGRRDLAILRSIGADQRWVRRAMHWQVTAFAVVPIVVGAAVGIVAGRLVFRALADSVGTVNDAVIPFLVIAAVGAAGVALANTTAMVPARRARRLSTATVLQAE